MFDSFILDTQHFVIFSIKAGYRCPAAFLSFFIVPNKHNLSNFLLILVMLLLPLGVLATDTLDGFTQPGPRARLHLYFYPDAAGEEKTHQVSEAVCSVSDAAVGMDTVAMADTGELTVFLRCPYHLDCWSCEFDRLICSLCKY